jgi:hypothetical protein
MTRRTFLITLLNLLYFSREAFTLSLPEMSERDILSGLLEALIPSDGTPGAKEVKLHDKLAVLISKDSRKRRIYDTGLSTVRNDIEKAKETTVDWDGVLERISPSPFFMELRKDAMRLFYSDPVSWKTIGYEGPPVIGYSDYHKCG